MPILSPPVPLGLLMSGKPQSEPPSTATARIAVELLEKARVICAHTKGRGGKQLKLTDYLDSLLRKKIESDHAAVLKRIREGGDS
jgi:hypothetical protein